MQTHTQSKDRGSLPRVYGSSTATDKLGTRVRKLRISKFIGMPSRRRRDCQSQKVGLSAECPAGDAHTDRLTSSGRNDIAACGILAGRSPLLFECWSRSRNSNSTAGIAVTAATARTGDRGVTAMHSTPAHQQPLTTLPRRGWKQLAGHGCHADMGLPRRRSST